MATSLIELEAKTWKEVSTVSCTFQNQSVHPIWITEAAALPVGDETGKIATPLEHLEFRKKDGNFYAYAKQRGCVVAIDPV